jgi:DNA topoisomerase-1
MTKLAVFHWQLQDTSGDTTIEKIADYQRANKEVAILCNHQRSISKGHGAQMERLEGKMTEMEVCLLAQKTPF